MKETHDKASYEMYATVNRFTVLLVLCASIVFAGLAVIFATQLINRQVGYTNQAYQKVNLCILSYPPGTRSGSDIQKCYDDVRAKTGITLERYDHFK